MGKLAKRLILLAVLTAIGVGIGVVVLRVLEARQRPSPDETMAKALEAQQQAAGGRPIVRKDRPDGDMVEAMRVREELLALAKEAPDEAGRRLRAFIEKAPDSPDSFEARLILAGLLAKGGDAAGALKLLDAVAAEPNGGPRATRARIERARLQAKSDPATARRDLEAILRDDAHEPTLQNAARLELGRIEVQAGQFLPAIATLTPLTQRGYAEKATALDLIRQAIEGHVEHLAKANNPQAILDWGAKVKKDFPELTSLHSTMRYHQAAALRQTGRLTDARLLAERLRRDDPTLEPACAAELQRITDAETAAGTLRDPAAFRKAKADGKESRAHFEGDIAADTTWAKAQSPLVLTASVTVKQGATLTVEPGTVVQFLLGARLVVQGALVARGTAEAPIRFTSAVEKEPTPFDGEGIFFADSSDDARCILERCTVEYQRVGVDCAASSPVLRHCVLARSGKAGLRVAEGAEPRLDATCRIESNDSVGVLAQGTALTLRRCLVLKNGGDGIRLADKAKGTIEACRIRDNAGHGIALDNFASPAIQGNEIAANRGCGINANRFSQPAIQGNAIRDNAGSGIHCTLSSAATITGNLIEGNRDYPITLEKSDGAITANLILRNRPYGLHCAREAAPQIEGNWIEGNSAAGIIVGEGSAPVIARNAILGHARAISNSSTNTIQARDNYFGDVPDAKMADLLFDKGDENALGEIIWQPRLTAAPPRPPTPTLDLPPLP